jgi:hypothetical protein
VHGLAIQRNGVFAGTDQYGARPLGHLAR